MIDKDSLLFKIFQKLDPAWIYIVIKFFKFVLFVADLILDNFFGTTIVHGTRQERKEAAINYEKSAQLVKVLGIGNWHYVMHHLLHNYLYYHQKYISPRYVLEHDNVTLSAVTEKHAIFCVSGTLDDVLDTSVVPFMFITQFFEAKQLIIVPHESFHMLAEEVGDPKERLVVLGNSARSGSTLLCQMFKRIPNTRVMSEPWGLCHLHGHYVAKKFGYNEYCRLIKSTLRLQCKPTRERKTDMTLLKLPIFCTPQLPLVKKVMPKVHLMYSTRGIHPTLLSIVKMFKNIGTLGKIKKGANFFYVEDKTIPYDDKHLQELHKKKMNSFWNIYSLDMIEVIAIGMAGCLKCYVQHRDIYDRLIIYEDLLANYNEETLAMFKAVGIPTKYLERTKEALNVHSQGDVFMTSKYKGDIVPKDQWELATRTIREWGVPLDVKHSVQEFRDYLNTGS